MTDWTAFTVLGQNVVAYLTGSYLGFGLALSALFFILFIASGIEVKYAFPLILPIMGAFSLAGWFGEFSWIINVVLLITAVIYAYAMYDLLS